MTEDTRTMQTLTPPDIRDDIPTRVPTDDVVIRFRRQLAYEDRVVFQASVQRSPALLEGGPFALDIEERLDHLRALFDNRIFDIHRYEASPVDVRPEVSQTAYDLADLGVALYELLPEPLREGLPGVLQRVFARGRALRLVFEAKAGDHADSLLSIPWEILYVRDLKQHLGLMPRVVIVRRLLETVRRGSQVIAPPFRVAHVIAEPAIAEPISDRLQAVECERIRQAAGGPEYYALVARPGSVEHLLSILRERSYQVVHFLGHGQIETQTQQAYVLFTDADGVAQAVTGEQLQHLLSQTPGVQLVVLNACHGASLVAANTVAMQLVYSGVPYVVAMQGEVQQQAAAVFAGTFYAAVQKGTGVEQATMRARLAIAAEVPGAIDWSLPALYVSAGVADQTPIALAGSQLMLWLQQPQGERQLGAANLIFGGFHLLMALLLILSDAAPPLPSRLVLTWVVGLLAAAPPLVALAVYRRNPAWLSGPARVERGALLLRLFGAAAVGLSIAGIYAWLLLLLLAAFGLWAILIPAAQAILIGLAFVLGILLSWQVALSHGNGLLSNAPFAGPSIDWGDSVAVLGGYIMFLGPLAALWLVPQFMTPPLCNLIAGAILVALGYQFRKEAAAALASAKVL